MGILDFSRISQEKDLSLAGCFRLCDRHRCKFNKKGVCERKGSYSLYKSCLKMQKAGLM